ncbi:cyclic AMP-responsive element-binding protein 5-like [Microcaecilia unicolor]|uniref:Cyclic AMP-responsive element-binding protein 5-like n=1 Tax=Microcaecilia unicolor TaxID=1415580 RepID=A0A6P7YDY9_9AMPH|nr:cyclic AMP-responsive element-binding protein 5-like [Microcaecilia unicolor]
MSGVEVSPCADPRTSSQKPNAWVTCSDHHSPAVEHLGSGGQQDLGSQIYEESEMNLEQERTFVCTAPGCSQRFRTEDHLMIHRHKHEMTLKFPSLKNDNVLADQTPTPTRFLKNCDEVGLFNDIDCSLEHEFRKAQEEENSKRCTNV